MKNIWVVGGKRGKTCVVPWPQYKFDRECITYLDPTQLDHQSLLAIFLDRYVTLFQDLKNKKRHGGKVGVEEDTTAVWKNAWVSPTAHK